MNDRVAIENLLVDCVVGVYPHERDSLQPLRVDLELFFSTEPAAMSERLQDTANYHAVAHLVVFLLRSGRFRLLETAAHVLAKTLLAPPAAGERRPALDSLRLRLEKPGALRGAAVPSLTIERGADWVQLSHENKCFGIVDVVHETKDAGVYRLNIEPGRGIPLHMHKVMRESEMVLGDRLLVNGERVRAGTVFRWPHGAKHRYDNPSDQVQTVLCVDCPPFDPDDERLASGEPDRVEPEPFWGLTNPSP